MQDILEPSPRVTPPVDDPAEVLLSRLFAKFTGAATVGPDDSFFELGGDSMSGLRLIVELRTALGKAVDLGRRAWNSG